MAESGTAKWLGPPRPEYVRLCVGLVVATALCVLVPVSPAFQQVPLRDSGAFLYIGKRILAGEVLYREAWDHKPPLIHYINALGLLLGSGSRWGVWALECLSLWAAVLLSFAVLSHSFSTTVSAGATALWLISMPHVVDGGNLTEEYVLPIQFLALYLLLGDEAEGKRPWRMCLIGCTGAVAFLLKQTLIATWVSIVLYLALAGLLSGSWQRTLSDLAGMFLGGCLVLIAVVMPSLLGGAIGDLWDASFRYNVAYGRTATLSSLESTVAALRHMTRASGLLVASVVGWFGGLTYLLRSRSATLAERGAPRLSGCIGVGGPSSASARCHCTHAPRSSAREGPVRRDTARLRDRALKPRVLSPLSAHVLAVRGPGALLGVSLLALPFEIGLTCLSGRFFPHYCIGWLPTLGVLSAFSTHLPPALGAPGPAVFYRSGHSLATVWLVGILALGGCGLLSHLRRPVAGDWATQRTEVSRFIEGSTSPTDSVLVWGAEPGVLYQCDRVAPTRLVYQYPLYVPGYDGAELVDEVLESVRATRPLLIIDSLNCATPLGSAQVRDCASALRYERPAGLDAMVTYIELHYRRVGTIGPEAWPVYARDGS